MVVRRKSTDMYAHTLHLINEDHPSVHHLRGFAAGGRVGREWSGTVHVPAVQVAAPATPGVDVDALASAVVAGVAALPPVRLQVGERQLGAAVREAMNYTRR